MSIINLYKLNLEKNTEKEVENIFSSKSYKLIKKQVKNNIEYKVFLKEVKRKKQNWLREIEEAFDISSEINIGNVINGIILIKFIKETNKIYMLTYGYAFSVAQNICDTNFALDFAEREIGQNNIVLKNSHFIENAVLKEIINYKDKSSVLPETGEIYKYISGKPSNENLFGKNIECGYSIRFNYNKEFNFSNLENLIQQIELVINKKEIKSSFPRIKTFNKKDSFSEKLDKHLLEQLKTDNDIENKLELNLSKIILGGTNFYFDNLEVTKNIYVKQKNSKTKEALSELNIVEILKYIKKYKEQIQKLSDVKIELTSENGEEFFREIKDYLFIEMSYENEKYILNDGNWGLYNEKFFEVLDENLDCINNQCVKYNKKYNINYNDEDDYINKLVSNDEEDYLKLHKKLIRFDRNYTVEIADIYDKKNDELLAIKLGSTTSNLSYCFEQGITSQTMLKSSDLKNIKEQLERHLGKTVDKEIIDKIVNCKKNSILLVIETHQNFILENGKMDLKKFKSLLLKLKIVHWYKTMLKHSITPNLYIQIKI